MNTLLLQVGGGDLDQFMAQPFVTAAFTMLCLFGFVLVILVGMLLYVRRRKAEQALDEETSPQSLSSDLPDLTALTTPLLTATPPRVPTTPAPVVAHVSASVMSATHANAVEVMRVLRDVVDGGLLVEIGGQTFGDGQTDAVLRGRVEKVVRELQGLLNAEAVVSSVAAPAQAPSVASVAPAPAVAAVAPSPTVPLAPAAPTVDAAFKLPSFKLDEHPLEKLKRGRKNNPKPLPEINLAGAIEGYLQHKLTTTGAFAGRSLHIVPAPDGGVSIELDGRAFETVGDVDEADVREFLSATIQEWQAQQ